MLTSARPHVLNIVTRWRKTAFKSLYAEKSVGGVHHISTDLQWVKRYFLRKQWGTVWPRGMRKELSRSAKTGSPVTETTLTECPLGRREIAGDKGTPFDTWYQGRMTEPRMRSVTSSVCSWVSATTRQADRNTNKKKGNRSETNGVTIVVNHQLLRVGRRRRAAVFSSAYSHMSQQRLKLFSSAGLSKNHAKKDYQRWSWPVRRKKAALDFRRSAARRRPTIIWVFVAFFASKRPQIVSAIPPNRIFTPNP